MLPTKQEWLSALSKRHGKALQNAFSEATVAICGLGGLGSNIATHLARAGIGKLIIIDFDNVELTNIHRQQYKASQIGMPKAAAMSENLKEISPYITVISHNIKLSEENILTYLSDADIICEAFDNPEQKAMLTNFILEKMPEKYLVAASGMAGMKSPNLIKTRKITNKFYLCGDEISDVKDAGSLFSARVAICASHQAHTVLRIIAGEFDA